jgi:hypothetical protein
LKEKKMNIEGLLLKHAPILACIVQWLTPMDWICLVRAFPSIVKHFPYRETLNEITRKHLFNNLKCYFQQQPLVTAQLIMRNLDAHYAITGGFLLATITGDSHYLQGDLDIIHVIHDRTEPSLQDKLVQHGLMERAPSAVYARNTVSNLSSVIDYTLQQRQFQVMHVHNRDAYVKDFDLDFCKSYYNLIGGLVIFCLDSIIYKQCRVNLELSYFQICVPRAIAAKAEMVEARIAKYRARDYTICIESGMSDEALCVYLAEKQSMHDRDKLAYVVQEWNLFWANKR